MSLTTKPPLGEVPVRPEPAAPGAARPPPFDEAAALTLLIEEVIAATTAGATAPLARPDPAAVPRDPRATAAVLIAWLHGAAEATGTPPERLATLIEHAYARVLEVLLRRPAGTGAAEDSVRLTRDLILAALPGEPPPALRVRTAGSMPLRILVEELERAVALELGAAGPAPRPASGDEPGNVAAALLRWLRATAAAAGVPLIRLRGVAERALERTEATIAAEAAEAAAPGTATDLAKAREVLLAALGREARATATPEAPLFRPDLPLVPRAGARRVPAAAGRAPPQGDAAEEAVADEPDTGPGRGTADLAGPMELIRRYFEDFQSPAPGACSRHFVYPACRWQGGHWQAFGDAAALAAAYETRRQELIARGISGGRILMLRVEPVAATVAIVRALMTREGRAAAPVEEVEVAYTTVLTPSGWRIAVLLLP